MNIRQSLLTEHSKRQTMRIVEFIGEDTEKFKELAEAFFSNESVLAQRAAWAVSYCAELHPELIYPYLDKLLDQLERRDVHDAVKRNVMRLLQYIEIPERLLGRVYSHCVDLVDDPDESIAARAFALTVAANIAGTEPDLRRELQLIVKKHLPCAPAALRKRAGRIL